MIYADVIVIGAGLLGCFAARSLRRYDVSVTVLEKREDVCTGISRANTAVVYAGQDNKPGSLKAGMCRRACEGFAELCGELGVRFHRCGSLMVCFGENGLRKLRRGLERGAESGVGGLRIIGADEARALEPGLSEKTYMALYSENTGTVIPWELCIAAAENAAANGARFRFREEVTGIEKRDGGYAVFTEKEEYRCSCVVNCAGLGAEKVNSLAGADAVRIVPTRADYIVLGKSENGKVRRVVFFEPEEKTKGITLVPTTEGNVMAGPSELPYGGGPGEATAPEGLEYVRAQAAELMPGLDTRSALRTFASLRPNPYWRDSADRSIRDFPITTPEDLPGYISLAGIKTPGMTCADEIGRHVAGICASLLRAAPDPSFDGVRAPAPRVRDMSPDELGALIASDPRWGRTVCPCGRVSEAEIVRALGSAIPCRTVDGVKRRTGAGLGECQGSRCSQRVAEIIARELGVPLSSVMKDGDGSWITQ